MEEETVEVPPNNNGPIFNCPQEVLEMIFSYLDASSLYDLTQTDEGFKTCIDKKRKFWKVIDARKGKNSDAKTKYCVEKINELTTHFCIRGKGTGYGRMPDNFSHRISTLGNLQVIALENQRFDGIKVCLKNFPVGLKELSIKNSVIQHAKYFFKHSDVRMQNLRVLIVDGCRWMSNSYFKWISKYVNLEIFSAANCLNSDFFPAYIWNKDKCKHLRLVDFRFSLPAFGDDLVDMWSGSKPVHAVYFHNVALSEDEYGEEIRYNPIQYMEDVENEINDVSFEKYTEWVFGNDVTDRFPSSYLYKDPYLECTCNYKEKESGTSISTSAAVLDTSYFTAFHQEAMSMDWDRMSDSHYESEYMQSDDEVDFSVPDNQLDRLAIRRLSLRGYASITDVTLRNIQDIQLDVLDVTGTSVTEDGIKDYLNRYPQCRVVHSSYCVCVPSSPF